MRKNISSTRTKQMLSDVLAELLSKKSIDKITIQDITDKCNINRQTFYYHFHDIYELTEWMFYQKATSIIGCEIDIDNWNEALLNAAHYIKDNKSVVVGIINSVGYSSIIHFIMEYVRPYIKNLILKESAGKNIEVRYTDFLSNYCTIAFSSLLIDWVVTDYDEKMNPEELLDLVKLSSDGYLDHALNNYHNFQKMK